MSNTDNTLEIGLSLTRRGFAIFPVNARDKTPLFQGWPEKATKDVMGWSAQHTAYPSTALAVHTGPESGVFVLDVDNKNGKNGSEALRELEEQHSPLPPTLTVRTPTGGFHYYFQYPQGAVIKNSTSDIGEGLDIKSHKGYVVAPGSVMSDGRSYIIVSDVPPAPAPQWLIDQILATSVSQRLVQNCSHNIIQGRRNSVLASIAGSMRRNGATETVINIALQQINEHYCKPPLGKGEVSRIAESISRYMPEFTLTNTGNAQRFDHVHGHNVRYCEQQKQWLFWDGRKWMPDLKNYVCELAKDIGFLVLQEAINQLSVTEDHHVN